MTMSLRKRRSVAIGITLLLATGLSIWFWGRGLALRDVAFVSGWWLFSGVLFLAAFNLRKKLPHPPLLKASTWLQMHIYGGLLVMLLFVVHVGLRVPGGPFGTVFALLFIVVALSGLFGLALSRTLPGRLSVLPEEVIFERIPILRRQLREQMEALLVEAAHASPMRTLPDFYRDELLDWFQRPAQTWRHLLASRAPLHAIETRFAALERYLNERERELALQMLELVRQKDALDQHHALQGALKLWLFVHIPATFALILFAVAHVLIVYAFAGALS